MVEVDMPVRPLGCQRNRFLDGACHPDKIPAQRACRMGLANRQRMEGCETLDRLTSATAGFRQGHRFDCSNYWATWMECASMLVSAIPRAHQHTQAYRAFAASRVAALKASPALDPATALFFTGPARWDLANDS
jgi:hypothetical protein